MNVKPGERITATAWNAISRFISQIPFVPRSLFSTTFGLSVRRSPGGTTSVVATTQSLVVAVRVKKTGGSDGGPYTEPTFTYSLYRQIPIVDADGNQTAWDDPVNLLTSSCIYNQNVLHRTIGLYEAAPNGTFALAVLSPIPNSPDFQYYLMLVGEREVVDFCNLDGPQLGS